MPNPITLPVFELKGYVDACIDAYQDGEGIPFAVMETIQKKVNEITKTIEEGHA